jgi:two-component system, OmpR family, heavy metal sensor histidine kinase CusS
MQSDQKDESGWSLTGRMALTFAITTSSILLFYALWSTYFVFGMIREDMKSFMEDELGEVARMVEKGTGTREEILDAIERVLGPFGDRPCAIRARNLDDTIIAEAGSKRLLRLIREPIDPDGKWRERLLSDQVATHAIHLDKPALRLAIVVDLRASLADLKEYLLAALLSFLIAVACAAVAGFATSIRGLRSLRDVAAQSKAIGLPTEDSRIELRNAPEEIRAVGAALNSMLERIQTGLRTIRTFTAGLAHELRSPLMNLIGETEVTLLSRRTPEEYEELLHSNLEDLHYLSETVDNLVAYCQTSQPETDQLRAEFVDLAHEAELRIDRLRRSAQREGVRVQLSTIGDTTLQADREGCLRVLRNLVGNAITWSPHDSTVDVVIEGTRDDVRIVVTDQGQGVPPELGDRIFEAFVSGPPQPGHRSGYGLGLAICKSVMRAHGGTLGYVNVPGSGARFTATFPRILAAEPTPPKLTLD